jgi:hypothetical protein
MARLSRLPSRCETSVKTGGILVQADAISKRKEHTSLSSRSRHHATIPY